MPLYVVRCEKCGEETEIIRSLANYDDLPSHCGEKMRRVIVAPAVIADIQPYKSMITGEMITSRSKHRTHLKEHGCTEVGNETPKPRVTPWLEQKKQKEELRREISARLDSAPRK